jgi:hypothetical protein
MYSYDGSLERLEQLVQHLNRLQNPLISLKTEEDV